MRKTIILKIILCSIFSMLIFPFLPSVYAVGMQTFSFEQVNWTDCYDVVKQEYDNMTASEGISAITLENIKLPDNSAVIHGCRSLSDYNGEAFSDFLQAHDDEVFVEIEAYSEKQARVTYSSRTKIATLQNVSENINSIIGFKGVFIKRASNYFDTGKVYFVRYDIPYVCAIVCDDMDIPQYVVYIDDFTGMEASGKNNGSKKLVEHFNELLNYTSIESKKQYVFDFDFYINVIKAFENKLPDDYIYTPSGLEAAHINKVAVINGKTYHFDENGRCTGLYNGWAKSKKGRRYYRDGTYITGKWRIKGKEYRFDDNGYIMI